MNSKQEVLKNAIHELIRLKDATNRSGISDGDAVIDVVIKCVQRRTPTKVEHTATIYKCCTCPTCGNVVDEFDKWGETYTRITTDYCRFCGQALDWSDEERSVVRF